MTKLAVALAFLGLNFYTYHYLATDPEIPDRQKFADFPMELGEWSCAKPGVMSPETIRNLGVTDYLLCNYSRSKPFSVVGVYIGYHATQVREEGGGSVENSIHPPAHCLPGSGWDIIDSRTVMLTLPGLPQSPAPAKRMVIARAKARQLTYYWYQSRGRVISEDWKKVLFVGFDRAVRSRTDGSLVRFTIPLLRDDEARAEADFQDLAARVLALVPPYVPN